MSNCEKHCPFVAACKEEYIGMYEDAQLLLEQARREKTISHLRQIDTSQIIDVVTLAEDAVRRFDATTPIIAKAVKLRGQSCSGPEFHHDTTKSSMVARILFQRQCPNVLFHYEVAIDPDVWPKRARNRLTTAI